MTWNFDISEAPRGRMVTKRHKTKNGGVVESEHFEGVHVILATKCGKVTKSYFIPDADRWLMLAKGEQPVAWQPWPEHPEAA